MSAPKLGHDVAAGSAALAHLVPAELVAAGVGQIGILVESLDTALPLYGRIESVERWNCWTYGPGTVPTLEYRGQPGRFAMRVALGGAGPQVELIEPLEGPSIYHEWIQLHGHGLHHLGFFVTSLDDVIQVMRDAGFDLLQRGSGYGLDGDGGFAYFDTLGAANVLFEAIEVPARRRPPERIWTRAADPATGST